MPFQAKTQSCKDFISLKTSWILSAFASSREAYGFKILETWIDKSMKIIFALPLRSRK
jgi:uncharacterized membrane protein